VNLLYTITAYPPSTGGAQIAQHWLAQHLSQQHRVQVVSQWDTNRTDWLLGSTLRTINTSRDYTIDGISVHQFGLPTLQKMRLAPYVLTYYGMMATALPHIVHSFKPHLHSYAAKADIIHNIRVGREGLSYASLAVAQENNIPFIFTPLHHPRWIGWRYKAYIELYQKADAIIALTNAEKMTLIDFGVLPKRIFVTGIGPVLAEETNPSRFLLEHHIDGPFVLFLGQHYPYKGYQQLLEATELVWQKYPEVHFVFLGPHVGNSHKVLAHYPDRRIHQLGTVDLQTKSDALAACTLLCVPSTQESFGGVYTEAWSYAKPVIGCNIPAVAEVIADGVDGYLVEQKAEVIADYIIDLFANPSKAQQMGRLGQQKVETNYNWATLASLTEQVYWSVTH